MGVDVAAVTGTAGTISSGLCRRLIASGRLMKLVLIDRDEDGLYRLLQELREEFGVAGGQVQLRYVLRDVAVGLIDVFSEHKPRVVYHAAAYKHVPMGELFPGEFVRNNLIGTLKVLGAALRVAKRVVFISTDKAVRPASIMGMTKRVGEMLCQAASTKETQCIAVRFGNVWGSRGSVIELFEERINRGQPIEITDERMERWFMSVEEAVDLVIQAGEKGEGGKVYALDMGEQKKLVDVAKDLIRQHDLRPNIQIPVIFTSPRPGEKFREALADDGEELVPVPGLDRVLEVRRVGEGYLDVGRGNDRGILLGAVHGIDRSFRDGEDDKGRERLEQLVMVARGVSDPDRFGDDSEEFVSLGDEDDSGQVEQ